MVRLVKLQCPPPDTAIFFPAFSRCSRIKTERFRFPASRAHIMPAAPAPIMITSFFTIGIYYTSVLRIIVTINIGLVRMVFKTMMNIISACRQMFYHNEDGNCTQDIHQEDTIGCATCLPSFYVLYRLSILCLCAPF